MTTTDQFHCHHLTRRDREVVAAVLTGLAQELLYAPGSNDMSPERMQEFAESLLFDYDGDDVEFAERCASTIPDPDQPEPLTDATGCDA